MAIRQHVSFGQINRKIDYMISIAEKEGLQFLSEKEVESLIEGNNENAPFGFKAEFGK